MSLLSVGRDVPVSQMPKGMAFENSGSGYGVGDFFGDLGQGLLSSLGSFNGSGSGSDSYRGSRGSTSYTDRTKDTIAMLMLKAMDEFASPTSVIS